MESVKLPILNAEQIRVLGSLIEKSRTTPDYYPMSLNSLQAACNQKSSRKPVVEYDENIVSHAISTLKTMGLVGTVTGGGSRTLKYKHNLAIVFPVIPSELSILCLIFLRGPLTIGEINSNSGRLYEFENLEEIQSFCEKLEKEGYLKLLPKKAGQKEQRYMHLFAGDLEHFEEEYLASEDIAVPKTAFEERIIKLETEVAELREKLEKLMQELGA